MVACNDDDMTTPINPINQLPPATMTGENTFGCLMNGEPWVAMTPNSIQDDIDVIFDEPNNFITLQAKRKKGIENAFFSFAVTDVTGTGTYRILDKTISGPGEIFTDFENANIYYLDTLAIRSFEITLLDTDEEIISSKFQFTLIEKNYADTLVVTEGRMDAKYRQ